MERYIYINCAYEDQQQVMPIIRQIQDGGIKVYYGNGSEEKVAGSICVIHFCTAASHTSKSYRKIMNYALKHEVDSILLHLEGQKIISDVEMQLDALHILFKYKYRALTAETKETVKQPEATEVKETVKQLETIEIKETAKQPEAAEVKETAKQSEAVKAEPAVKRQKAIETPVKQQEPAKAELTKDDLFREGRRWLTGDGCDVDERKAFAYFKQAANQGHTEAQYQLSICYDRGMGVRRSITEAAKWCQMAAYGGHAQAQSEIGYCYEYGQGVVRNIKEAVRWYQIASEQGNVEAKNNLAFCYQKGKGVLKNVDEAIRLYQEAAEAGHASAQYNLGFCYWYGEGIESDKIKAIELFERSAANGNAKASQMLKILNQRAYLRK